MADQHQFVNWIGANKRKAIMNEWGKIQQRISVEHNIESLQIT